MSSATDGPTVQDRRPLVGITVSFTALLSKPGPMRSLDDSKQVHDQRRRPSNHVFQPLSACHNAVSFLNLVHSYQEGSDHHRHASSFLWNLQDKPAFVLGISAASTSPVHTSHSN